MAGVFAGISGILLGFPVLRLRGDYLAIVPLGFGEIIRVILLNWYEFTGGPDGISGIPRPSFFGLEFKRSSEGTFSGFFGLDYSSMHRIIFLYYLILALALLTNFVTLRLRKLPVGRAWEALREDELNPNKLGELMNEHHYIVKSYLKITPPLIDQMIDNANISGALGSKIVGSG